MINNTNEILTQNLGKVERIIKEFVKSSVEQEQRGELTVNSMEKLIGTAVAAFMAAMLAMAGALLSNIVLENVDKQCNCGFKMVVAKKNGLTHILSLFGKIPITRDTLFCRRCHRGHGVTDSMLEIDNKHRMTKGLIETVTYVAQLVPSFERASKTLKKLLKIDVSTTQIQIVSEEVGQKIFNEQMQEAQKAYEKPEITAPQALEKDKKDGNLYIFMDGSHVNTRVEDKDGSTWKEMKLGLVFTDRDVIKRKDNSCIITKKEYVSYFGEVQEFKKVIFTAAAKAGYGKIKKVVVVGDGASWIWNMCEELFPDAVRILDFYHLSKNVNDYAKALYPIDELNRKRWVERVLEAVLAGNAERALELIDGTEVKKSQASVVNLSTYINNNRERINYPAYKAAGYYIGSGPIESANKTVIQQRMKQAGMRWGVAGGQYIAALRAKHESNLWDDVVDTIYAS